MNVCLNNVVCGYDQINFLLIIILKLDYTVKYYFQNKNDHHSNKFFLAIGFTVSLCMF